MKKKFGLVTLVTAIVLISCQKEVSFDNANGGGGTGGGGGGSTSGTQLVKIVSKTSVDSNVTVYTYDANKRLINQTITGSSAGTDVSNEFRYYRDASGIITHYTQINPSLVMVGVDSSVSIVHYSTSSSRYTSVVSEISLFGFSVKDSTIFVYNAAGKVTNADMFQDVPLVGMGYQLTSRKKYTYSGGNMSEIDIYDVSGGTEVLAGQIKYTFDAKSSPLVLGNEGFAIGKEDLTSANNGTKAEIIDAADPTNNRTLVMTYNYNSSGRPATGTTTLTPGNVVSNLTFFYQ